MSLVNGAKTNTERDRLFATPQDIVDFAFDAAVADVFPDMIRRSVPGYDTVVRVTGLIAAKHLPEGGRCYDLGCSLGAAAHAVLRAVGTRPCEVVAVDHSAAMLGKAQALAEKAGVDGADGRLRWLRADVRDMPFAPANVVIANYTMQFLPPPDRLPLLHRIRAAVVEGGVLVLAEKLADDDYFADLHLRYKRANGYSELEIAQKRTALENVMRIDTADAHLQRLRRAGFATAKMWFRCLNWGAFVAWPS